MHRQREVCEIGLRRSQALCPQEGLEFQRSGVEATVKLGLPSAGPPVGGIGAKLALMTESDECRGIAMLTHPQGVPMELVLHEAVGVPPRDLAQVWDLDSVRDQVIQVELESAWIGCPPSAWTAVGEVCQCSCFCCRTLHAHFFGVVVAW